VSSFRRPAPPAPRRLVRGALGVGCAGVLALAGAAPSAAPVAAQEDEVQPRGFSIYDTQGARALALEVEVHLAAQRWNEGIDGLQRLIEDNHGEVLGATRPWVAQPGSARARSQGDVHYGASNHAARLLFELPEAPRELYEKRFGREATAALAEALAAGDRAALSRVARRWPITAAARKAWWALGDVEVELGNLEDGIRAWGRALGHALGQPDLTLAGAADWSAALAALEERRPGLVTPGTRRRVEFATDRVAGELPRADPRAQETLRSFATAIQPGAVAASSLGHDPDRWPEPFLLPSGHPFRPTATRFPLYAARWQDFVFVSTTMELLAVNAFTGEPVWNSGEPPGWEELTASARQQFMDEINMADGLIAPVAGQGVVVAALQIPFTFEKKVNYGEMKIIGQMPNRRLFAFDARTGDPLWDTRPPPNWDGESGSFGDRMRIVGTPILHGSRLLVPAARLRGRIEYHVGCFDLHTGEELWSTALITGQRELNMFGRMGKEFCAPPLRVVGNRVIALTQLGTLAAVDLFTGDILWEVLYDQIEIRPNTGYNMQPLEPEWQNAPPVVVGDTLIATPFDSRDLIAVDATSGGLVWSLRHDDVMRIGLGQVRGNTDYALIGADQRRVFFAGASVVALEAPGQGVSHGPVKRVAWIFPPGDDPSESLAGLRPVLASERVYVPGNTQLFVLDRDTGQVREQTAWSRGTQGNLLVGDGMVFTLGRAHLQGYFEWDRLLERARSAHLADPGDLEATRNLARLLWKRGVASWQGGEDVAGAARHIEEARRVLESFAAGDGGLAAVGDDLHEILCTEARVMRDLARRGEARELFARARELAPTSEALRDTLLEEQALLRGFETAQWIATLDELLESCSHLEVGCQAREDPDGSAPWAERLEPVVGTRERPDWISLKMPVGLWVLLQRAEAVGETRGSGAEFEDLHEILRTRYYRDFELPGGTAGAWASARIAAKLSAGEAQGYELFEARASALLDRALDERDDELLAEIPSLYPHSRAAQAANDARLRWAADDGDGPLVARIVDSELPETFSARDADERQVRYLLRLADVLGGGGNERLRAGLVRELAAHHPSLRSDLEGHDGQTLAELAEAFTVEPAPYPPEPTFDHGVRTALDYSGSFHPVGLVPPAQPDGAWVALFADGERLFGIPDPARSPDGWNHVLGMREAPHPDWPERFVPVPGLAVLATRTRVVALRHADGEQAWAWPGGDVLSIDESDGVVVALVHRGELFTLAGLDAAQGTELWQHTFDALAYRQRAVCGDGRLVVLPSGRRPKPAEVRDLFTGRLVRRFEVGELTEEASSSAWIEDGRLIVPHYPLSGRPARNYIAAIDLGTGSEAWRIPFGEGRDDSHKLSLILRYRDETYMLLRGGSPPDEYEGELYQLSPGLGAISSRPIVRLRQGEIAVGIVSLKRNELPSPYLFLLKAPPGGTGPCSLRAIHLPYGPRWEAQLPFTESEYDERMLPMPALSDSSVVFGWRSERGQPRGQTELVFLDRTSGVRRDSRTLRPEMDSKGGVQFVGIGSALVIAGAKRLEVWR